MLASFTHSYVFQNNVEHKSGYFSGFVPIRNVKKKCAYVVLISNVVYTWYLQTKKAIRRFSVENRHILVFSSHRLWH